MNQPARRYVFRFIHQEGPEGWTVRDTISGQVSGSYATEDDAVRAAVAETSLNSEDRSDQPGDPAIPLE